MGRVELRLALCCTLYVDVSAAFAVGRRVHAVAKSGRRLCVSQKSSE